MSEEIHKAVRQWLEKAESDWRTVNILLASENKPTDVVCFHCQQSVEKLLKALLTQNDIEAPRTHDIRRLVQLSQTYIPELAELTDVADKLTVHGVETRYPGDFQQVDEIEMQDVIELTRQFREIILPKLK